MDFCRRRYFSELENSAYSDQQVIESTQKWLRDVVIAHNFCPFAARELLRNSIRYVICRSTEFEDISQSLLQELSLLDEQEEVETTLVIYPEGLSSFEGEYLNWLEDANDLLVDNDYDGVYQVASFHPHYLFEGTHENDPSNYTNRSPFPMIHLLREESLDRAIAAYPNIERVPELNIEKCNEIGLEKMKSQLLLCYLSLKA